MKIQRHAVFAIARMRVADHEHRDALHGETPDHAERVQVGEKRHVAAAGDDREDLEKRRR